MKEKKNKYTNLHGIEKQLPLFLQKKKKTLRVFVCLFLVFFLEDSLLLFKLGCPTNSFGLVGESHLCFSTYRAECVIKNAVETPQKKNNNKNTRYIKETKARKKKKKQKKKEENVFRVMEETNIRLNVDKMAFSSKSP